MLLTLLGTGTSTGVPVIGCTCETCSSSDPRDKRLRTSALLDVAGERILFDCGPDFRQQMLRTAPRPCPSDDPEAHLPQLSAIFITHEHADHVCGLDDLRPGRLFGKVPIYAEDRVVKNLRARLPYCFLPREKRYPGVPAMELKEIRPYQPVRVGEVEVLPLRVWHGKLPILGFRIGLVRKGGASVGPLAYITDMSTMDPHDLSLLHGLRVFVVNALRPWPHPSHQTVSDAIRLSERLGSPETYLIHLTHDIRPYRIADANLPPHVHYGYDGLQIRCS